ncbi:MAG: hypothetical protein AAGH65_09250, partial [Pseudomonadota bacterium]
MNPPHVARSILLACAVWLCLGLGPRAWADDITIVTSWDQYRELMIEDGRTAEASDRRIGELLFNLRTLD